MRIVKNPALQKGIYIALLVVVLLIVFSMLKKKNASPAADSSGFIDAFVKWLKRKEGHASKDPDDDAAANAFPDGTHTYMGITKTTFEGNASKCGYSPTYSNFVNMSPQVWWCNYEQFWNKGKEFSNNLILSTYMSQWYWGGWYQPWLPKQKVLDVFNSNISDREKLKRLIALRKQYFIKVVENDPTDQKYLNGWNKKHDEFWTNYNKYLSA